MATWADAIRNKVTNAQNFISNLSALGGDLGSDSGSSNPVNTAPTNINTTETYKDYLNNLDSGQDFVPYSGSKEATYTPSFLMETPEAQDFSANTRVEPSPTGGPSQVITSPGSYTAPTLENPSEVTTAPEVKAGSEYVTPESTVQGQLASILQEGSPLLDLAQSRSRDEAQKMGLLSSSMAVGAGQQALYDAALPIAKQDASTFGQFQSAQQGAEYQLGQTGYEGDITSVLKGQEGEVKGALQGQQGTIQSKLLQQEQAFNKSLTEFEASETFNNLVTELASQEGRAADAVRVDLITNAQSIASNLAINDAEMATRIAISGAQIDQQDRADWMDAMKDLTYGYNENISKIMSIPDEQMSPEVKWEWIGNLQGQYMDQTDMFTSVFGQKVNWGSSFTSRSTSTSDSVGGDQNNTTEDVSGLTSNEVYSGLGSGYTGGTYGQDIVPDLGW